MEKRRAAESKLHELQDLSSTITEQRKVLLLINSNRLDFDKYYHQNSTNRVKLFETLRDYLSNIQSHMVVNQISTEIKTLFTNLSSIFLSSKPLGLEVTSSSSADGETEKDDRLTFFVRIGLETLRLWKKLSSRHVADDAGLVSAIADLERAISSIPCPMPSTASLQGPTFQGDNTTVILYFDHLLHDTPPDHMESEARVQTSLRLITQQVQNHRANAGITESSSKLRDVVMVKCNEIISAPFWTLPLVHSPDYLSHLWSLSEEAKEFDLLVPLEFDTEWESLDDFSDDEDERKITRKKNVSYSRSKVLKSAITIPDGVLFPDMNEERVTKLLQVLQPNDDDEEYAKLFFDEPSSAAEKPQSNNRRRRDSTEKRSSLPSGNSSQTDRITGDRRFLKNRQSSSFTPDITVHTPYGVGKVSPEEYANSDRPKYIIPVSSLTLVFLNQSSLGSL
jgi:hypothetical protein